uniref:MMS1_N domain-containing protein n=1 Tax=Schistocephalus solidus TaxID=70667 RepID=A0A183S8P4_SCHSO
LVTHSVFCNILHPKHKNLVLVRGTTIEIYEIKESRNDFRLSFVTSSMLYEEIEDIVVVRFYGHQMDSLLLSFKEAKVAAMTFDIHTYELRTCSLHTYEDLSLKVRCYFSFHFLTIFNICYNRRLSIFLGGRLQFTKTPMLRVDPLQRCAVMLVYDRYLAVLPFRRADALSSAEHLAETPTTPLVEAVWQHKATAPILSTFTTFLSTSTGERINNVIDMKFLYGFYEPTLFVLYEPIGTWAGRVSARRDTCCIVALSLNLQKRTNPVIWFQEQLPFDCHTVIPIPMPVGGVLIIAANSIIYLKQTLPSCGLPLNCYSLLSTDFPLRQEVPACGPLSLDGCCASLLNPTQVLISARGGTFYILTLWLENATNTVTSLVLSEAGTFTPAESITLMDDNLLFIGSSLSDSLLLRYRLTSEKVGFHSRPPVGTLTNGTIFPLADAAPEPKRARLDSTASIGSTSEQPSTATNTMASLDSSSSIKASTNSFHFDDTDVELYGPSIQHQAAQCMDIDMYSFEVLDCLRNIGPMANITAGEVPCLATGHTDPSDEVLTAAQAEMAHIELIASIARPLTAHTPEFQTTDSAVGGGIALLHRSVRAHGLTAFELPEYNSLWSLYGPPVGTFGEKESVKEESEENEKEYHPSVNGTGGTNEAVEDAPVKTDSPDSNASPPAKKESSPQGDKLETETVGDTDTPKENSDGAEVITESKEDKMQQLLQEKNEEMAVESGKQSSTPSPPPASSSAELHSYLLLTREDSTMILEVGEEIVELEVSGFNTTETTVIAANLGRTHYQRSKSPPLGSIDASPSAETAPEELTSLRVGKDYPYILQVTIFSLISGTVPHLFEFAPLSSYLAVLFCRYQGPPTEGRYPFFLHPTCQFIFQYVTYLMKDSCVLKCDRV